MAMENKDLLVWPKRVKKSPTKPCSNKYCQFHKKYVHHTDECQHLKNEIKRLIHNGHLQNFICKEKECGTGPYKRHSKEKHEDEPSSKEHRGANGEESG